MKIKRVTFTPDKWGLYILPMLGIDWAIKGCHRVWFGWLFWLFTIEFTRQSERNYIFKPKT